MQFGLREFLCNPLQVCGGFIYLFIIKNRISTLA